MAYRRSYYQQSECQKIFYTWRIDCLSLITIVRLLRRWRLLSLQIRLVKARNQTRLKNWNEWVRVWILKELLMKLSSIRLKYEENRNALLICNFYNKTAMINKEKSTLNSSIKNYRKTFRAIKMTWGELKEREIQCLETMNENWHKTLRNYQTLTSLFPDRLRPVKYKKGKEMASKSVSL